MITLKISINKNERPFKRQLEILVETHENRKLQKSMEIVMRFKDKMSTCVCTCGRA